jgi:hypothetical protein
LVYHYRKEGRKKMKKSLLIIGVAVLLITVGLCGCFGTTRENRLSGLGYSNTYYGFGLNPPLGWSVLENDPYGAIVRFYITNEEGINIHLSVDGPSVLYAGQTLNSAVEEVIETCQNLFKNFTLLSSNSRTANGMNAYEFIFTLTQEDIQLKHKMVCVEMNRKVYMLTYGSTVDSYDDYHSIAEESINTLVII